MKKLYYYYDPILKSHDNRYSVDYFHTDGKTTLWSGRINGDTHEEVLTNVRQMVEKLNEPRPLFGINGRLASWIHWKRQIRNQKKS